MKAVSLRSRLLVLIVLVLAAVLLPLGVLSAMRTLEEVDELSDGRLAQAARTLEVLVGRIGVEQLRLQRATPALVPSYSNHPQEVTVQGRTYESEVGFQVFDRDGSLLLATENLSGVPRTHAPDGQFEDISSGSYKWRVFTLIMQDKGLTIRAGERYDSRHEITHALWIEHGLPTLLGLPLLAVLVGWAIRRGLLPLQSLADALAHREPGSREPIHLVDAPTELSPVLAALNDQIGRLESALERERRFSADVAHELRTPLASTMINLESALVSARPDEAQQALEAARACLVSLARRTEQLLALARLEVGAASGPRGRVDLVELALDVVDELSPVIGASGVELALNELPEHVWVDGYAVALGALLRNLLENAFRHVPRGGSVELSMRRDDDGAAVIDVMDDGPGIPEARRTGMFTRFQRGLDTQGEGYGLGLSIVQRAAELHGATIQLLDRAEGTGLRVVVRIPGTPDA